MSRPTYERINQYRILWVFVFFDLPVKTKKDKREYVRFRKLLQADGFAMMQYSIYVRHCNSRENAEVHMRRVKKILPTHGEIIIFTVTDRQFGDMEFFSGPKQAKRPDTPQQLELFE
jgi:CRISPR-associated protein Cas2